MNPIERTRDVSVKNIEAAIIKYSALDGLACLMLSMGLYGKFAAQGEAFMPILNNSKVVNGLLFLGVIILVVSGSKLFSLMRQKAKLNTIRK